MNTRAQALAVALEQGTNALATFAAGLSESEWQARLPHDNRKVGVVVHHVANMYPIEIQLTQALAGGGAISDLTWDAIHEINANHAKEQDAVTKEQALAVLRTNGAAAAAAIRALSDADLDRVAPNSLYGGAPLSCQFWIEDHALRHSFHHLAGIHRAVGR
jgi:hypothetical protein